MYPIVTAIGYRNKLNEDADRFTMIYSTRLMPTWIYIRLIKKRELARIWAYLRLFRVRTSTNNVLDQAPKT